MKLYRPYLEDEIELCDADGKPVKTVRYSIDVNKSYKEITARRVALATQADIVMKTGDERATEKLGSIFIGLLNAVFGKETTQEIMEWYDDGTNLIWLMLPILVDKIFPALETQREQLLRLKELGNRYAPEQEADNGD